MKTPSRGRAGRETGRKAPAPAAGTSRRAGAGAVAITSRSRAGAKAYEATAGGKAHAARGGAKAHEARAGAEAGAASVVTPLPPRTGRGRTATRASAASSHATSAADVLPDEPASQDDAAPGAPGTVKSLAKGLRTLDLLLSQESLGATEVARMLGIDKGAASRILRTLADGGFAVQGGGRRYRSGPKLQTRASGAGLPPGVSVRERARPLLERLHQLTRETAHLAIRADDQVLYLDKVDTDLPLRVDRPVGTLAPLHCTALGKVLLAFEGGPLPRKLVSFTVHTSASEATLQAAVERIVASGYAIDDEEFGMGIRCVAAPLLDAGGQVLGAIGVSGPTARIAASQLDELGMLVKRIADQFRL